MDSCWRCMWLLIKGVRGCNACKRCRKMRVGGVRGNWKIRVRNFTGCVFTRGVNRCRCMLVADV